MVRPEELSLLTDLYELTMAQSYFQKGMFSPATFSLFVRKYPPNRAYFVSAGLEDVLHYLEDFRITQDSIDYLRSTGIFSRDFLDFLATLRFTGEVWAIPEGRLFFCDEPVLEVTAPIIEAQVVETFIINQINLQSLIATKAARCVWAARGRRVVDFSLRRTQGIDAGMKVARASYIAGCQATSNVLAGKAYGIPVAGTMAHSYVSSFEHEVDAFRAFAESFPERSIFLIDTYDTIAGAQKAVAVAKEMEARGHRLLGVRLDSGDLVHLSREVRRILDEAGLEYVQIVASGGLDEYEVEELLAAGAPIDSFGIGTKMGVSGDAPWLDMAYKLVRYEDRPVLKLSTGKVSLPDQKQVFRLLDQDGMFLRDVVGLRDERLEGAEPLLEKVMEKGRLLGPLPGLERARARFQEDFRRLPERFKALLDPPTYEVTLSPRLKALYEEVQQEVVEEELAALFRGRELGESR
jgi:nicotinate phosphoribosyltransferase